MDKEVRRITLDIDKRLWYEVGIESAKLDVTKREFVETALREKIEKLKEENHS